MKQTLKKEYIKNNIEENFFSSFQIIPIILRPIQPTIIIWNIFRILASIFTDKSVGVDDLSGPVGIFNLLKEATKDGFLTILNWTAILSVNLGFMNIIPLPALDGGRIAFMLYEGVTRKKPNAKVENIIHTIGFLLLMALMIFISFNDVLRCVGCK